MKEAVSARIRFGVFQLDLKAGELHKGDSKVRLQEQPFQVLLMLVERAGEVVSREDIQSKLWPNDTVVEFDHGINTAIRKLRTALNDSAEKPDYIETVARRGYRLIVPVEWLQSSSDGSASDAPNAETPVSVGTGIKPGLRSTELTPGKILSHYRVLNVVGGGGMGIVYRAEDLKLGRAVALKFLPEELGSDPLALARFEREARTASSLNHANICTIYEVEEHEGTPFIVMEYLEGMTLREMIGHANIASPLSKPSKQALDMQEVLDIAIQISEGLDAAHQKAIIHRDIKPANIFITRQRQVKILDFGLAKLITEAKEGTAEHQVGKEDDAGAEPDVAENPDTNLTREGASIGTTGYMSPEQVQGLKLDARTDLFCFGLVMYELVTGKRAFGGGTKESFREAVLYQTPTPMHELNPAVSSRMEAIVSRCLEKERNVRYQHASDLRTDLKQIRREMSTHYMLQDRIAERIAEAQKNAQPAVVAEPEKTPAPPAPPQAKSSMKFVTAAVIVAIALAAGILVAYRNLRPRPGGGANAQSVVVLPFADMSSGHDEEYFSEGLTDQLINDLARIPGLNVIARSSAFQFKGKNADPRTVGRALNVANVLEGSVRRDGNRIRINVDLTKAADGFQLWSQSYDRQIGDIFAVQDEIARAVADELQLKLTGANAATATAAAATTSPEAYQVYLQGRFFAMRHDPGDLNQSLAFADQAVKLDPKYAPAWALRAYVLRSLAQAGLIDNAEGYQKAREDAQAAIALDSSLADAYMVLADIQWDHDWDWAGAATNLSKAQQLKPGDARIYRSRASLAQALGNLDEAVDLEKKAITLDPLKGYWTLGATLYNAGRYNEAGAAFQKATELSPRLAILHYSQGALLLAQGRPDQALTEMQQEESEAYKLTGLALAYQAMGRHKESDDALNSLIEKHQKDSPYQVAEVYAYRNQVDEAFAWLDRAYDERDSALPNIKIDPLLVNLRHDLRYTKMLEKMKLNGFGQQAALRRRQTAFSSQQSALGQCDHF